MKQRKGLLQTIMTAADLPSEPLPGLPLVELAGDHRVLIENHCGVTAYSDQEICVRVKYGQICISGNNLELLCMTKERLIIQGSIDGVQLFKGGR